MATYTITEVMARLKGLPEKMAQTAVDIMRDEINISTHGTGELAKSVKAEKVADGSYTISTNKYVGGGPYGIKEVGAIIRKGRPALQARYKKSLHWIDAFGEEHYAKSVGPAQANDFVARTKNRLEHLDWTLEGGK